MLGTRRLLLFRPYINTLLEHKSAKLSLRSRYVDLYGKITHTCEVSDAGCARALVADVKSHTSILASCALCVSVCVCETAASVCGKQRYCRP